MNDITTTNKNNNNDNNNNTNITIIININISVNIIIIIIIIVTTNINSSVTHANMYVIVRYAIMICIITVFDSWLILSSSLSLIRRGERGLVPRAPRGVGLL